MYKRLARWLPILLAVAATACGPDDDDDNGIIRPGTNSSNANNNNNNQATNNVATNNGATNNAATDDCEMIEDFSDESFEIERAYFDTTDVELVSCSMGVGEIATDGSYVVKLQYSEETTVTISARAIAAEGGGTPPRPAVELRSGSCSAGDVVLCDNAPELEATLEAGQPYYLFVNGLLDTGGVRLSVDADIDSCTPGEPLTCAEGITDICSSSGEPRQVTCPGDCEGSFCQGDACTNPVVITPEANGDPVALDGNRVTFSSTWSAEGFDNCETVEGAGADPTPGGEFFVLVEGVTAGQTVVFDGEPAFGRYGFFVLPECTATSCLGAYEFDDNNFNRGAYTATADGDVLAAVEFFGGDTDRDFTIEISVRD